MTPESVHRSASPSAGTSGRRVSMIAAALGIAALLAGVALLARSSNDEGPTAGAREAGTAPHARGGKRGASAGGPSGPGGPEQAGETAPRYDATTCWRDLERFNEAVTVGNFREWAAPLLASRDPLVRMFLKERLTELIGNDAGRASEVLAWTRDAGPKEFKVFAMALKDSEAVHLPQVAAKIVELGLDGSLDGERRAGVLSALDTQKKLDPAVLGKLADFARAPEAGEAGWAATRTIARVMQNDFNRTGNAAPYLDKLLTIGTESLDEHVRYMALSTPMETAPVLDAKATERFAKVLTTEGSPDGRGAAAHNLALSGDKTKVLETFARAFEPEQDLCVRWALFRFAARAAGRDALPVMANMAVIDPRFQPTYQDFERVYASGIVDFERVWLNLSTQDPHGCLHRD